MIKIQTHCYILIIILLIRQSESVEDDLTFPKGLLIGAATAAYQVEGAWNVSGRGVSIWDYSTHNYPDRIVDNSTGDVTTDMYHKYKEDIQILENIGLQSFRFSISWSRILPNGYESSFNKEGVNYYHRLLDELEKRNITPVVTIYHWDHPQILEGIGGWLNEQMAFIYSNYARIIYREFGHRVKIFLTVNEPEVYCKHAYVEKFVVLSPTHNATNYKGWGRYLCIHNILKAHALAYHIYNNEFRSNQNGKIGLTIPCEFPISKNKNDTVSADLAFEFRCGQMLNPIFSKTGDYPKIMKSRVALRSRLQGYKMSRLPTFTQDWVKLLRGSADFLGLNHYTSLLVEPLPASQILKWPNDEGLKTVFNPEWKSPKGSWTKFVPEGFRGLLRTLQKKYNNPPVYVFENGAIDNSGINDDYRMNYLYGYMKELLYAIKRDKCNIHSYTIWSLLDSFEWNFGYATRFGIVDVDFNDKNRKRTLKKSAVWLKATLKAGRLISPNSTDLLLV